MSSQGSDAYPTLPVGTSLQYQSERPTRDRSVRSPPSDLPKNNQNDRMYIQQPHDATSERYEYGSSVLAQIKSWKKGKQKEENMQQNGTSSLRYERVDEGHENSQRIHPSVPTR